MMELNPGDNNYTDRLMSDGEQTLRESDLVGLKVASLA